MLFVYSLTLKFSEAICDISITTDVECDKISWILGRPDFKSVPKDQKKMDVAYGSP